MQKLKMIPCPRCGNPFPELRKTKFGYNFCVNCSTVDRVVGITTVEGTGDHTYNDIIIMDRQKALAIAKKEAEIKGKKFEYSIEVQDYEKDEGAVTQSVNEKISASLNPSDETDLKFPEYDTYDPNAEPEGIEGIDY